jgi:hypothetical protein
MIEWYDVGFRRSGLNLRQKAAFLQHMSSLQMKDLKDAGTDPAIHFMLIRHSAKRTRQFKTNVATTRKQCGESLKMMWGSCDISALPCISLQHAVCIPSYHPSHGQ